MLQIEKLDIDMIDPSPYNMDIPEQGGSKIVIIGKPGTGKSRLVMDLLYNKADIFPSATVFSGTEDSNCYYSTYFPDTFIFNTLDMDAIQKVICRQKIARQAVPNPWTVLLVDDCSDDPKLFRKPLFQSIFKNGRHWKMLFVLALQYCVDIPPSVRVNIDGVFIFREPNMNVRKKLYDNYASIVPTFADFCRIMDVVTEDHGALFIRNNITSNDWRDGVFWYRAGRVPDSFRFGSDEYWAHAEARARCD